MDPLGFPGGSDGKESVCNTGDPGSIPGSRRSPIEGNGYPLQYSCLENPMERRAWWATGPGVTKSWTRHVSEDTLPPGAGRAPLTGILISYFQGDRKDSQSVPLAMAVS